MGNIILFDTDKIREDFLPITFTRPLADIRLGITTIRKKWELEFPDSKFSYITAQYLQSKYRMVSAAENIFIAGHILPSGEIVNEIKKLNTDESLFYKEELIAFRGSLRNFKACAYGNIINTDKCPQGIRMLYDIFLKNGDVLISDYIKITAGREPEPISSTNVIIGDRFFSDGTSKIFIEKGARIEGAFLNVTNGPIYIGKNAEIMEGTTIRGPFAACDNAVVNMGTKIYGATTLGPFCKVGGEVNNIVMLGYSNKAHDGFLGNAVIGEWCNIGAGTNASNLKNDYTEIKLWNYHARRFLPTGLQFCGLIMGDHSKAGINCMFNTATVIGVGVNIYGSGFPRNFVASFSEGGTSGFMDVPLAKFFNIAQRVMSRRNVSLSEIDRHIFESIHNIADNYK